MADGNDGERAPKADDGVLGNLPASRPQRRSSRRTPAASATAATAKPTTARAARPAAATRKPTTRTTTRRGKPTPRAAKTLPKQPPVPPVPRSGWATPEPPPQAPSSTGGLGLTAIVDDAIRTGERVVRGVLRHLTPR